MTPTPCSERPRRRAAPTATVLAAGLLLAACAGPRERPDETGAETVASPPEAANGRGPAAPEPELTDLESRLQAAVALDDATARAEALEAVLLDLPPESAARGFVAGLTTQAWAEAGDLDRMAKVAREAPVGDDLATADVLNAMAYAYAEAGEQLTEAHVRVEQALQILDRLAPEVPAGHPVERELALRRGAFLDTLGWIQFRMGDLPEARQSLEQALEVFDHAEVREHLGQVLEALGEPRAAVREYARSLALAEEGASELSSRRLAELAPGRADALLAEARDAVRADRKDRLLALAVDEPLPALTATDLERRPLDLAALSREGVTVLWFWATWCEPCLEELPELEALQRRYGEDAGVRFLAVSVDASPEVARQWLEDRATPLPVAHAPFEEVATGLRLQALPALVVVGPQGRIRFRHQGTVPELPDVLPLEIEALQD